MITVILPMGIIITIGAWAWHRMTRYVPRNRVRAFRLRLRMRLRPGRGFATAFELWLRWGRFAALRSSKQIRPDLSPWQRIRHPELWSVLIGTAQRGHKLRVTCEEACLIQAPPRQGKTAALLADIVLSYPGPAVSTSVKPDVFALTSGVRGQLGPLAVFNPQSIGGVQSTLAWSPTSGCRDPQVAERRASAFAGAVSVKGTDGGGDTFWTSQAAQFMGAAFMAADLCGGDLRLCSRWLQGSPEDAEAILRAAGADEQAAALSQLRSSSAQKTLDTVRLIMKKGLQFLGDPELAASVLPNGSEFDIPAFLEQHGTLYAIAEAESEDVTVAPVFAALLDEIHTVAKQIGSKAPGGRLTPPAGFFLDEVANIAPVPLNRWGADSGGRGIQLFTVCHGDAQLRERWGRDGARVIQDTHSVKILLPGVSDTDTLQAMSKLAGEFTQLQHDDKHGNHPVVTEAMIRQMPTFYALVIRGNVAPVVARLPKTWRNAQYRKARRNGQAVAVLQPAARPVAIPSYEVPAVAEPADDVLGALLTDVDSVPERVPADNPWGI